MGTTLFAENFTMSQHQDPSRQASQSRALHILARRKNRICGILTLLTLLAYYGFMCLLAFAPDVLSSRLGSNVTLGIPLGIGVIVAAWILTGIYVWWANTRYDAMVREARAELER